MLDIDKCCMTRFPAPVLSEPAKPVQEITDDIRALAEKMIDIMIENKGVGLAAPQAGFGLRMFVFTKDGTRENAKVYINPEIELSGGLVSNSEGCLSLPGIEAGIKRFKNCTITATNLDGKKFTAQAEGIEIRGFQHECDHLDGMMIKDRMSYPAKVASRKLLKRMQEEFEQKNS